MSLSVGAKWSSRHGFPVWYSFRTLQKVFSWPQKPKSYCGPKIYDTFFRNKPSIHTSKTDLYILVLQLFILVLYIHVCSIIPKCIIQLFFPANAFFRTLLIKIKLINIVRYQYSNRSRKTNQNYVYTQNKRNRYWGIEAALGTLENVQSE